MTPVSLALQANPEPLPETTAASADALGSAANHAGCVSTQACNNQAAAKIEAVAAHQASAAAQNTLASDSTRGAPAAGANRTPAHVSQCPIHATGCQRRAGSPSTRSIVNASAGTSASSTTWASGAPDSHGVTGYFSRLSVSVTGQCSHGAIVLEAAWGARGTVLRQLEPVARAPRLGAEH